MLLVSLACLIALAVTLVAVYRDDQLADPEFAAPRAPHRDADAARVEFPVRPFGYAPAAVDAAYEALRLDYADMLAEAPPEAIERARRRAARRTGMDEPEQERAGVANEATRANAMEGGGGVTAGATRGETARESAGDAPSAAGSEPPPASDAPRQAQPRQAG